MSAGSKADYNSALAALMQLRKLANHPLLERFWYDKELLTKMANDYVNVSYLACDFFFDNLVGIYKIQISYSKSLQLCNDECLRLCLSENFRLKVSENSLARNKCSCSSYVSFKYSLPIFGKNWVFS